MAETSGFFQSVWDDSLENPITQEQTGWWDKSYTAKQFLDYFALFIGNGVFGSPTNQCKVIPGTGLSIIITPGWAFIKGAWYHNETNKEIELSSNTSGLSRTDGVMLRYNDTNREITGIVTTGNTELVRGETIYDLKIAEVVVAPNAVTISGANITDTRIDETVCGLVKGLMEIETTADLFAQYQALFDEWFDEVKDQVTGDLAIRLQMEFTQLNQNVEDYQEAVEDALADDRAIIEDYVYNDYIIQEQEFVFTNKVCTIQDAKVKATSLIDVYFTAATINNAEEAQIVVDSSNGYITLTAAKQPEGTIRGMLRVRVNEVS